MSKKTDLRSIHFSSKLQKLLGETPLLEGEDRRLYAELKEAIEEHMAPQDLFEELDVRDIVNAIWESRRFEKQASELVNAEWSNAIRKLAAVGNLSDTMAERLQLTKDSIPAGKLGLGIFLSAVGATKELVQAHALLLAVHDYSIFDKLAANRIARRKTAVKDYENRRRQAKKDKQVTVKAKQERTKLANDNRPAAEGGDWESHG